MVYEETNKYQQGKIYCIRNTINDMIYIGSTCQKLSQRMTNHRSDMNKPTHQNMKLYKAMNELGKENFYIQLVEDYPCENIEQLLKRETELMLEHKADLNKNKNGRTVLERYKEYKQTHEEEIKESNKKYREANKETLKQKKREDYIKNREHRIQQVNANRKTNKEKYDATRKKFYEANKEELIAKSKARYEENKDEINARRRDKAKLRTDEERKKLAEKNRYYYHRKKKETKAQTNETEPKEPKGLATLYAILN